MCARSGMVSPDTLLEDLLPFMESGPKNHHVPLPSKRPRANSHTSAPKVLASMETTKDSDAPISTEETAPKIVEWLKCLSILLSQKNPRMVTTVLFAELVYVFLIVIGYNDISSVLTPFSYYGHSAVLSLRRPRCDN